tara:strand:+ start:331 stop:498 length:168 start_codon:yes stop_codon:yes gene_type:complete
LRQIQKSAKPWYYANLTGEGRECKSRQRLSTQIRNFTIENFLNHNYNNSVDGKNK